MGEQVVFITGASQGLGAELARLFAAQGARLVLTARRAPALDAIARELEKATDLIAVAGDVADDEHVRSLANAALHRFGRVDVLINNASTLGASPMPQLEQLDRSTFSRLMDVNVRAPLHIAQLLLPQMRSRGFGLIVNVTSDAAVQAYPGWGGYGSSKAALEHLSRILAEELSGSGVRVVAVDPGNMNTQMHRDAEPGVDLSDLPPPKEVAAAMVRALANASAPFARLEIQALVSHV